MLLNVRPLEKRIVLEGSGIPDLDGVTDAVLDAPSELDGYAQPESDDQIEDSEHEESDAAPVVQALPSDASDTISPPPLRLLLISSAIQNADGLAAAASDSTPVLTYDANETSLQELSQQIQDLLAGRQADSIALATHNDGEASLTLTNTENVSLTSLTLSTPQQDFFSALGESIKDGGRLDLLACDVAGTPEGDLLVLSLEDMTGTNVAASTDYTGDADVGGDWILETDNIDTESTYFDSEQLDAFDARLAKPNITNLDNDVVTFTENLGAIGLDNGGDALAADGDGDYNGGYLDVKFQSNTTANDRLTVVDNGNITVS
ncbi:MAG: DUF4347 domain-containing protein, partial [Planctomycetota bacterium]